MSDCLFCKIVAGEIPARKVHEDADALAFLDIEPLHEGHTLVVSKRHVANALEDPAVLAALAPSIGHVGTLLMDRLDAAGLNVLSNVNEAAGQSVYHLHVHLIPRYADEPGIAALAKRTAVRDQDEILAVLTA